MSSPKRHHIIPRFLLERFCQDGLLWVYDRDRAAYRRQQPVNTAVVKRYYTAIDEDGQEHTAFESMLAVIEGEAKPIIEMLQRREGLNNEQRGTLALFVALLHYRVPEFERTLGEVTDTFAKSVLRTSFSSLERSRTALEHFESKAGEALGVTPELMMEIAQKGEFNVKPAVASRLATIHRLAISIANVLYGLDWFILHTPLKKAFATSDNPVSILPPKDWKPNWLGVGLLTPGSETFVPLGSTIGLLFADPGDGLYHRDIRESAVRHLNLATTERAEGYVFARDERLLRNLITKSGLADRARGPRLRFG